MRDINGKGVLAGLTEISEIQSHKVVDDTEVPCEGKLYYRGIDVEELVSGFISEDRFGFEETAYLLLFGKLPTKAVSYTHLDVYKRQALCLNGRQNKFY